MSWLYRVPGEGIPVREPESPRELVWPLIGAVVVFGVLVALGTCTGARGEPYGQAASTQKQTATE